MIPKLTSLLSQEITLLLTTWNYHWNVRGSNFPGLHALFQKQYEQLIEMVDDLAERIRASGGLVETKITMGLLPEKTDFSMVTDLEFLHTSAVDFIKSDLLKDLDPVVDCGVVDLLNEYVRDHEKMIWMLQATSTE